MPPNLQKALSTNPDGNVHAAFDAATQLARAGFRVLPCQPGGKAPATMQGFANGARSASSDYERVRDCWLTEPTCNVGLAPDGNWIVLDVDPRKGGSLEVVASLGLPVDGYRERSGGGGWHIPLMMPRGAVAIQSLTIAPGIEVKSRGTYVVSPHSWLTGGGRYAVEQNREVWAWPAIASNSPLLEHITQRMALGDVALGAITASHRRDARRVIRGLAAAPIDIARDAAALMAGVIPEDASRSEADYRLALLASFHTGEPETIAAVLESSRLRRSKWYEHPTYVAVTIAKALERRRFLSSRRRANGGGPEFGPAASGFQPQNEQATQTLAPVTVSYGTSLQSDGAKGKRFGRILEAAASTADRDAEGFARLPVTVLADSLNVTRRTITRDITELESLGLIETQTRQPAGLRRERWVRLSTLGRMNA